MGRWSVVVAIAAVMGCGGTAPSGSSLPLPPKEPKLADSIDLIGIARTGDAKALAAVVVTPLGFGGMWFPDPTCRRQFGVGGLIPASGLDELARCLATIQLQKSDRDHRYAEISVYTYEPGFEIEVVFTKADGGTKFRWIGFTGRRDQKDALPTITQRTLESLRVDPAPVAFAPATQREIESEVERYYQLSTRKPEELDRWPALGTWFKICIDATGAVTGVHPRQADSLVALKATTDVIKTWSFRPFKLGDQPSPVCSLVGIPHRDAPAKPMRELPLPVPMTEAESVVLPLRSMGDRVAGTINATPDDASRAELKALGNRVRGTVVYCIDTSGSVRSVAISRSSGSPSYDRVLMRTVAGWRYHPVAVAGTPVRACSSVTFAYSGSRRVHGGRMIFGPDYPRY